MPGKQEALGTARTSGVAAVPAQLLQLQTFLAAATRGTAIVATRDGTCLRELDFAEGERRHAPGTHFALAEMAGAAGGPRWARGADGSESWALPLAGHVVLVSTGAAERREAALIEQLREMLPRIATIVNGEAVLFDDLGELVYTSLPNGKPSPNHGQRHEELAQILREGRPEVARSRWVPGATAVRIPLTPGFGFAINNALSVQFGRELASEASHLRARHTWDSIVGDSPEIRRVREQGKLAAVSRAHVLIYGESGTGKELLAQAIHNSGPRRHMPFLSINCGALTATLVESLLFGYVPGAFTGARRGGQVGLFERANGGTLLLDEISEMEMELQVKLLRVIEEEEVVPVGGHSPRKIDVRIVSTANRDLARMAEDGRFRHDLFYRLNVFDIDLPPLRERAADIPRLAQFLLGTIAARNGTERCDIAPAAVSALTAYRWPGNIRELRNALERATAIAENGLIEPRHLPAAVVAASHAIARDVPPLEAWLAKARADAARAALEAARGNKAKAARMLGVSTTTFWRMLKT